MFSVSSAIRRRAFSCKVAVMDSSSNLSLGKITDEDNCCIYTSQGLQVAQLTGPAEFTNGGGFDFPHHHPPPITKGGEIGSSIIPHKVNPVDFKYSEGNLGKASGCLSHISTKLPISHWLAGDLTGSTRNIAEGVAHSHLSHTSLCGIAKLQVNEASWNEDLNRSWEVLAEPMQAHGRWEDIGIQEPHEKLKELTRGRAVTKENLKRVYRRFIIG